MQSRLHWTRGRQEKGVGISARTLEWVGCDDAGETIARVVRVPEPAGSDRRRFRAVALDAEARVVELRPAELPDGAAWLAFIGGRVVGRAAAAMEAVRLAEGALGGE